MRLCHALCMGRLLLLFIVVPAVELALLIEVGQRIGTVYTLALIVVTGIVGASLARREGMRVLSRIRQELDSGAVPGDALVDGLMILVASALLVTPGILTDAVGFLCLIPVFREAAKRVLRRRFEDAVLSGQVRVNVHVSGTGQASDPYAASERTVIDVTPDPSRDP